MAHRHTRLKEATFHNIDAGLRFKVLDDRLDGEITFYIVYKVRMKF